MGIGNEIAPHEDTARHLTDRPPRSHRSLQGCVLNLSLSTVSRFYLFFLTDIAGIRPGLASLALLIARIVDAFVDPLMGRISDITLWKWGRRRPYLALGGVPFGLTFACLVDRPRLYTGSPHACADPRDP